MSGKDHAPRSRGRPKKIYKSSGRHAVKQQLLTVFSSEAVNIPTPSTATPTESISAIPSTATATPTVPDEPPAHVSSLLSLTSEEKMVTSLAVSRPGMQHLLKKCANKEMSHPLFLDNVRRLGPIWRDLGTIETFRLHGWFDSQVIIPFSVFIFFDSLLMAVQ